MDYYKRIAVEEVHLSHETNTYNFVVSVGIPDGTSVRPRQLQSTVVLTHKQPTGHPAATHVIVLSANRPDSGSPSDSDNTSVELHWVREHICMRSHIHVKVVHRKTIEFNIQDVPERVMGKVHTTGQTYIVWSE